LNKLNWRTIMTTKPRSTKRKFDAALATGLVLVSSLGFGIGFGARLYPPAKKVSASVSPTALVASQPRVSFLKSNRALKPRIVKPSVVRVRASSLTKRPAAAQTVQAPQVIRRVVRVVRQTSRPVIATTRGS
jgi:hypothetical protein